MPCWLPLPRLPPCCPSLSMWPPELSPLPSLPVDLFHVLPCDAWPELPIPRASSSKDFHPFVPFLLPFVPSLECWLLLGKVFHSPFETLVPVFEEDEEEEDEEEEVFPQGRGIPAGPTPLPAPQDILCEVAGAESQPPPRPPIPLLLFFKEAALTEEPLAPDCIRVAFTVSPTAWPLGTGHLSPE